jgi:hypothetical protein
MTGTSIINHKGPSSNASEVDSFSTHPDSGRWIANSTNGPTITENLENGYFEINDSTVDHDDNFAWAVNGDENEAWGAGGPIMTSVDEFDRFENTVVAGSAFAILKNNAQNLFGNYSFVAGDQTGASRARFFENDMDAEQLDFSVNVACYAAGGNNNWDVDGGGTDIATLSIDFTSGADSWVIGIQAFSGVSHPNVTVNLYQDRGASEPLLLNSSISLDVDGGEFIGIRARAIRNQIFVGFTSNISVTLDTPVSTTYSDYTDSGWFSSQITGATFTTYNRFEMYMDATILNDEYAMFDRFELLMQNNPNSNYTGYERAITDTDFNLRTRLSHPLDFRQADNETFGINHRFEVGIIGNNSYDNFVGISWNDYQLPNETRQQRIIVQAFDADGALQTDVLATVEGSTDWGSWVDITVDFDLLSSKLKVTASFEGEELGTTNVYDLTNSTLRIFDKDMIKKPLKVYFRYIDFESFGVNFYRVDYIEAPFEDCNRNHITSLGESEIKLNHTSFFGVGMVAGVINEDYQSVYMTQLPNFHSTSGLYTITQEVGGGVVDVGFTIHGSLRYTLQNGTTLGTPSAVPHRIFVWSIQSVMGNSGTNTFNIVATTLNDSGTQQTYTYQFSINGELHAVSLGWALWRTEDDLNMGLAFSNVTDQGATQKETNLYFSVPYNNSAGYGDEFNLTNRYELNSAEVAFTGECSAQLQEYSSLASEGFLESPPSIPFRDAGITLGKKSGGFFGGLIRALMNFVSNPLGFLVDLIGDLAGGIFGLFTGVLSSILSVLGDVAGDIFDLFDATLGSILAAIIAVAAAFVAELISLAQDLFDAGIQGMWALARGLSINGISIADVIDALDNLVGFITVNMGVGLDLIVLAFTTYLGLFALAVLTYIVLFSAYECDNQFHWMSLIVEKAFKDITGGLSLLGFRIYIPLGLPVFLYAGITILGVW